MEGIPVGTRVSVGSGDGLKDLGLGTYVGDQPMFYALMQDKIDVFMLSAETKEELKKKVKRAKGKVLTEGHSPTPKLQLDNGRVIFGSQCWWQPVQ
jgi:hypothetical protein